MEEENFTSKSKIKNLKFDVKILENGNLEIVETWNMYIDYINTLFKVFSLNTSKYNSISNVKVVEVLENGEEKIFFITDTLMQQVTKGCYYGLINENGEFEIAWGVDTKNETRTYKIIYTVSNILKNYNAEYKQLCWQFIGNNFTLPIENVEGKIEIESSKSIDNEKLSVHFTPEINTSIDENIITFDTNTLQKSSWLELKLLMPRNDNDNIQKVTNNEITTNINNVFNITKKFGTYFWIDENSKQWTVPIGVFKKKVNTDEIYTYNDIVSFELLEDGDSVSKGGVGRALVGGALFGGVGAIVGGVTGHKNKNTCTRLQIKITLNNMAKPTQYITFINAETKRDGMIYKSAFTFAQDIMSALQLMCDSNKAQNTVKQNEEQTSSSIDEIRKYKELLDMGAIKQAEFEAKKKELLNL